ASDRAGRGRRRPRAADPVGGELRRSRRHGGAADRGGLARGLLMRIDVVTLFPDMVTHAAAYGVTGRAQQRGVWRLGVVNPRDFTTDVHKTVDDRPYGGGPGMVLMAEPLSRALRAARAAQAVDGVVAPRTVY